MLTPEERNEVTSRVKGENTKPEVWVRSVLHTTGYRLIPHRKDLPGNPDVALPKHRTVTFVHGCFWRPHPGCRKPGFLEVPPSGGHESYKGSVRFFAD